MPDDDAAVLLDGIQSEGCLNRFQGDRVAIVVGNQVTLHLHVNLNLVVNAYDIGMVWRCLQSCKLHVRRKMRRMRVRVCCRMGGWGAVTENPAP